MLLAGEPSGDRYGGAVAGEIMRRWPGARLTGFGGPAMARSGVELLAGLEDLAVMGFGEVFRKMPFFLRLERRVSEHLRNEEIDLLIPIDYGGFNLRASSRARRFGIPVLYYVPPQIWAWRRGRVRTLGAVASRVAAILPFEVDFLEAEGVRCTFVGHPILDDPPARIENAPFRERWGLPHGRRILALLPGSRSQEVAQHLPVFMETVRLLQTRWPDLTPVVAAVPHLPNEPYAACPFPRVESARELLAHAHVALVKSGTSTLEAALQGTPFVVAYRTGRVSWEFARRLVRVEHVALPNLILGARVVPEFLQEEARPEKLADALGRLVDERSPAREEQMAKFSRVREALGTPGAAGRVADLAEGLLKPCKP